jgi:hypothetical protein
VYATTYRRACSRLKRFYACRQRPSPGDEILGGTAPACPTGPPKP